jgi:7-keto-8-aminopelargonate synthetase-like enzyme
MEALEKALGEVPARAGKLVVVDAVFSMDGDIINLPEVVKLCRKYDAMLMVDEAHSVGVLGETGHGILQHFDMPEDAIDIKMGTLSKTIPAVGGYIAGSTELITYLRHSIRAFIFSAALPPAVAAAAKASCEVIEEEPERGQILRGNVDYFIKGLQERGFNTSRAKPPLCRLLPGTMNGPG